MHAHRATALDPSTQPPSPLLTGSPDVGLDVAQWRQRLAAPALKKELAAVRGDFSVALADARGRTVLAVDRFATQTLCYRVDGGTLRYAERADQLGAASRYTLWRRVRLMVKAVSSFSSKPLTWLFDVGLLTAGLGPIGIYLGKVFEQAQNRPNYSVRDIHR